MENNIEKAKNYEYYYYLDYTHLLNSKNLKGAISPNAEVEKVTKDGISKIKISEFLKSKDKNINFVIDKENDIIIVKINNDREYALAGLYDFYNQSDLEKILNTINILNGFIDEIQGYTLEVNDQIHLKLLEDIKDNVIEDIYSTDCLLISNYKELLEGKGIQRKLK